MPRRRKPNAPAPARREGRGRNRACASQTSRVFRLTYLIPPPKGEGGGPKDRRVGFFFEAPHPARYRSSPSPLRGEGLERLEMEGRLRSPHERRTERAEDHKT